MHLCVCNKELKGINWSQYIDESALLRLPPGQTAPGFTVGRPYYLGFGNVYNHLLRYLETIFYPRLYLIVRCLSA